MPIGLLKNYRWFIVSLLFIATTINYLDRQIIGLLKPTLEAEFGWTESAFARIVMAFTAAYAFGLFGVGWAIDKVGTKRGYSITVIVWSLGAMLHAVVNSLLGFGVVRVLLGVGEAGNFPAAMKAVAEWFPQRERGLATGIVNAGCSVGVVAALVIVPWLLQDHGWRDVFWITGSLGFIWLIGWLWAYKSPLHLNRLPAVEPPVDSNLTESNLETGLTPKKTTWLGLFTLPQTWAIIVGKFFLDPIYWFFLFWLPSYFSSIFHLDLTKPNLPLMIIYSATTLGSISGGYFSSWLIQRGWSALRARKNALLVFAVLELSIMLAPLATQIWVVVSIISLAAAVHQAWATTIFTLASDLFPKEIVSSVVGIGGMAGAVGGILFPMLIGYLLDAYKTQGNLIGGYNLLFTLCGLTYLVVWLVIHLLTRERLY